MTEEKKPLLRLLNVQNKLKAPKNQYNSFGKYAYRSCEDILSSAKNLLYENQLVLVINDEIKDFGNKKYLQATVTIYDCLTDWKLSTSAFAEIPDSKKGMDPSQVTGASSSYARKYALNAMLCIDDTKDADATNDHKEEKISSTILSFEKLGVSKGELDKKFPLNKVTEETLPEIVEAYKKLKNEGIF
jgi:hypothetical protein